MESRRLAPASMYCIRGEDDDDDDGLLLSTLLLLEEEDMIAVVEIPRVLSIDCFRW